jgi:WD40 repeat protein
LGSLGSELGPLDWGRDQQQGEQARSDFEYIRLLKLTRGLAADERQGIALDGAASTDRLICLWDLRTDATQNISLTLAGHTAPVSAIAAHPTSSLMFASGSYDSTVRIWDARSPKQALFTLPVPKKEGDEDRAEPEKVLAVDWDGERLAAGGEGARVISWRVSGQGEPVANKE